MQVRPNIEQQVADSINAQVVKSGLKSALHEIVIPTERVVEMRRGKKVEIERKCLPGYIFLNMDLSDDLWHVIKQSPKSGAFLGVQGKPVEVAEEEVMRLNQQIESKIAAQSIAITFDLGESVKVNEGPFESFFGVVDSIDETKSRARVIVTIFGRSTPVELGFHQISKV